jgi:hypothetical protein
LNETDATQVFLDRQYMMWTIKGKYSFDKDIVKAGPNLLEIC